MKKNFTYILFFLFVAQTNNYNLFAQIDSSITTDDMLELRPAFHSIQVDGNLSIFSYEYGGHFDFDLFHSPKNICLGTRLSVEHYMLGDIGGKTTGSPFTNYNLYIRFGKISEDFSFNFLGGLSYYRSSDERSAPSRGLPRFGFEIKYGRVVGIILKGATSFKENTGFVGLGLSVDYCHIQ